MHAIFIILVLIVIACGALFDALNGARVVLDFYFIKITLPIDAALLGALLLGWVYGGLVAWCGHLSGRRRAARRDRTALLPQAPPHGGA
ncbi:MAG: lipopolysaccharide assembly protein LapA domain-containing protein [Dokdonella sp.]